MPFPEPSTFSPRTAAPTDADREFLKGALGFAGLAPPRRRSSCSSLFWTGRIVVDALYFRHDDWPRGELFVVGHTCLTTLFVVLAAVHWTALAWQISGS